MFRYQYISVVLSRLAALGGQAYTIVTSAGGEAITLATSGAGVVTSFAGSQYTVATSAAAADATSNAALGMHLFSVSVPLLTSLAVAFSGVFVGAWIVL